ncbi:hypothetical protein B0H34DRAFT_712330 [Crassisporium funariophilum]|nr:hypothetical protein B0H34DRAFT_712330 [Crassisporium funariophilum]
MSVFAIFCHKCHRTPKHQYLAIAIQLVVACKSSNLCRNDPLRCSLVGMLIMRTYALYERSRKVLALYIGVSAVAVAVGCWAVLGGKTTHKPQDTSVPIGCGVSLTHYQAIRLGAAWGGMLVFDFLVFAMTLYKSLTLPRTAGTNLLSVLFRDGAIYFGVMMAANLGNILTFMYGGPYTRGVATTFTNIISSVMISRLMLNLRHPALVTHSECTSCPTATDFTTNPNLTFLYSTQYTDETRGSDPERHVGRPEHDYVTRGPGRPMGRNDNDIELVLFDRQNQV